jgi:predicted DNA-binding protein
MEAQMKKNNETMGLRLPPHQRERLASMARDEERAMSWLIRKAIDKLLREYDEKKKAASK